MSSIGHWLAMGGYAIFVWPAYGLTAVVLGGLAMLSWRRHRLSETRLAQVQRQTGSGK